MGAARSGTTVLQNALNHSPSIFLLGEPDLHLDDGSPGFAARYNARHRSWGNQETKSTFLPPVVEPDGAWPDHIDWLAARYRWVGTKVVVNANRDPDEVDRLFAFHARCFYDAHYLFTFRDPVAVAASTRGLQVLNGGPLEAWTSLWAAYLQVVTLYTRMLRNLPHVRAVFHEDVGPSVIEAVGDWLATPLEGCAAYYEEARVRIHSLEGMSARERPWLELVTAIHADLRRSVESESRPQLEQNDANPDPKHYTMLGSVDRRARVMIEKLASASTQA